MEGRTFSQALRRRNISKLLACVNSKDAAASHFSQNRGRYRVAAGLVRIAACGPDLACAPCTPPDDSVPFKQHRAGRRGSAPGRRAQNEFRLKYNTKNTTQTASISTASVSPTRRGVQGEPTSQSESRTAVALPHRSSFLPWGAAAPRQAAAPAPLGTRAALRVVPFLARRPPARRTPPVIAFTGTSAAKFCRPGWTSSETPPGPPADPTESDLEQVRLGRDRVRLEIYPSRRPNSPAPAFMLYFQVPCMSQNGCTSKWPDANGAAQGVSQFVPADEPELGAQPPEARSSRKPRPSGGPVAITIMMRRARSMKAAHPHFLDAEPGGGHSRRDSDGRCCDSDCRSHPSVRRGLAGKLRRCDSNGSGRCRSCRRRQPRAVTQAAINLSRGDGTCPPIGDRPGPAASFYSGRPCGVVRGGANLRAMG